MGTAIDSATQSHAAINRNVAIEQYELLAAENSKLKVSLGDMIDKYKILYQKIRELQEEKQREREAQLEKEKQSINPFSIASKRATSRSRGEIQEVGSQTIENIKVTKQSNPPRQSGQPASTSTKERN